MGAHQRAVSIETLLGFDNLKLCVRAGIDGLKRIITTAEINRPALELIGFRKEFCPERIQVLGRGETSYLSEYGNNKETQANFDAILQQAVPCLVATAGRTVPEWAYEMANRHHVPMLETELPTTRFSMRLSEHLERDLAPRITARGVLMDIYGTGVLIRGKSGVGKSECSLELVTRGHTFIADDIIEIRTHQESVLIGTGRSCIPHHMEIRGLGIIDINRLFGPRATRTEKQINLAVTLEDWKPNIEYDRLGIDEQVITILNVEVPAITVPVRPGRNLSTIIEIAALNQKLKAAGIYMAREFDHRLIEVLRQRQQVGHHHGEEE